MMHIPVAFVEAEVALRPDVDEPLGPSASRCAGGLTPMASCPGRFIVHQFESSRSLLLTDVSDSEMLEHPEIRLRFDADIVGLSVVEGPDDLAVRVFSAAGTVDEFFFSSPRRVPPGHSVFPPPEGPRRDSPMAHRLIRLVLPERASEVVRAAPSVDCSAAALLLDSGVAHLVRFGDRTDVPALVPMAVRAGLLASLAGLVASRAPPPAPVRDVLALGSDRVLTACADGHIRLWGAERGSPPQVLATAAFSAAEGQLDEVRLDWLAVGRLVLVSQPAVPELVVVRCLGSAPWLQVLYQVEVPVLLNSQRRLCSACLSGSADGDGDGEEEEEGEKCVLWTAWSAEPGSADEGDGELPLPGTALAPDGAGREWGWLVGGAACVASCRLDGGLPSWQRVRTAEESSRGADAEDAAALSAEALEARVFCGGRWPVGVLARAVADFRAQLVGGAAHQQQMHQQHQNPEVAAATTLARVRRDARLAVEQVAEARLSRADAAPTEEMRAQVMADAWAELLFFCRSEVMQRRGVSAPGLALPRRGAQTPLVVRPSSVGVLRPAVAAHRCLDAMRVGAPAVAAATVRSLGAGASPGAASLLVAAGCLADAIAQLSPDSWLRGLAPDTEGEVLEAAGREDDVRLLDQLREALRPLQHQGLACAFRGTFPAEAYRDLVRSAVGPVAAAADEVVRWGDRSRQGTGRRLAGWMLEAETAAERDDASASYRLVLSLLCSAVFAARAGGAGPQHAADVASLVALTRLCRARLWVLGLPPRPVRTNRGTNAVGIARGGGGGGMDDDDDDNDKLPDILRLDLGAGAAGLEDSSDSDSANSDAADDGVQKMDVDADADEDKEDNEAGGAAAASHAQEGDRRASGVGGRVSLAASVRLARRLYGSAMFREVVQWSVLSGHARNVEMARVTGRALLRLGAGHFAEAEECLVRAASSLATRGQVREAVWLLVRTMRSLDRAGDRASLESRAGLSRRLALAGLALDLSPFVGHTVNVHALLWSNAFKYSLQLRRYDEAYEAVTSLTDAATRTECLRRFVSVLLASGRAGILLSFPWVGLRREVEDALFFSARYASLADLVPTAGASAPGPAAHPYRLLYAFAVQAGDYRSAAKYMHSYAVRLQREGDLAAATVLEERVRALLAALSALQCVAEDHAWLIVEDDAGAARATGRAAAGGGGGGGAVPSSGSSTGSKRKRDDGTGSSASADGDGGSSSDGDDEDEELQLCLVDVAHLQRLHALSAAHLELARCGDADAVHVAHPLPPEAVVVLLLKAGRIESAVSVSVLCGLDLSPVFAELVDRLVLLQRRAAGRAPPAGVASAFGGAPATAASSVAPLQLGELLARLDGAGPLGHGVPMRLAPGSDPADDVWALLMQLLSLYDSAKCNYRYRLVVARRLLAADEASGLPNRLVELFMRDTAQDRGNGVVQLLDLLVEQNLLVEAAGVAIEALERRGVCPRPPGKPVDAAAWLPLDQIDALGRKLGFLLERAQDEGLAFESNVERAYQQLLAALESARWDSQARSKSRV